MKLNEKSYSSSEIRKNFVGIDFNSKYPNSKNSKIPLKRIYATDFERNFTTLRDHHIKDRIVSECQKHDRIIGIHKKVKSHCIRDMQDHEMKLFKFRRTPSPEKKTLRSSANSPIKPHEFQSNEDHLQALSRKFNNDPSSSLLKLNSMNDKALQGLQKEGFVNKLGGLNIKFINRYEQVVGTMYPLKRSISSIFENKSKCKLNGKQS